MLNHLLITHDPRLRKPCISSDLLTPPQRRLTGVKLGQQIHSEPNVQSLHTTVWSRLSIVSWHFHMILYWQKYSWATWWPSSAQIGPRYFSFGGATYTQAYIIYTRKMSKSRLVMLITNCKGNKSLFGIHYRFHNFHLSFIRNTHQARDHKAFQNQVQVTKWIISELFPIICSTKLGFCVHWHGKYCFRTTMHKIKVHVGDN